MRIPRRKIPIARAYKRFILVLLINHPLPHRFAGERSPLPKPANASSFLSPHPSLVLTPSPSQVLRLSLSHLNSLSIASPARLSLFLFRLENQLKAPSLIQNGGLHLGRLMPLLLKE
ncbi:hypothetical protein ACLOJK_041270 [Asimina triloba]